MKILTPKQAIATIKLIAAAGKKLDERIHLVAVSGLSHFFEHGDSTALTELCKAMPKSGRGNALKAWITEYAPLKWVMKENKWKKNGDIVEEWGEVLETANANPFYDKTDKEPAVFVPENYAKAVLRKLEHEGVSVEAFVAMMAAPATQPVLAAPAIQ